MSRGTGQEEEKWCRYVPRGSGREEDEREQIWEGEGEEPWNPWEENNNGEDKNDIFIGLDFTTLSIRAFCST